MAAVRAGGGAARLRPSHERERKLAPQRLAEPHAEESPSPHVFRLVLHPDCGNVAGIWLQSLFQRLSRQRIELLDAKDRHIVRIQLLAALYQFKVNLAGAEQD